MALESLLRPITIGKMELRNRIVVAPMATGFTAPDGSISERIINYHEAQAKGGAGLIITGSATVNPLEEPGSWHIGLWDDKFVPGFKELAKAVHAHGTKLATQLVYPSSGSDYTVVKVQPMGQSLFTARASKHTLGELATEDIGEIIERFAEAARRAREAGCDSIELHAAHGHHLMGSFMSPLRNKRFDAYGGSLEGRLRFPIEVIRRIKAECGNDFPIIMRISGDEMVPGGQTLLETEVITPILVEAGVNAFEISGGVYPELSWWVIPPMGTPLGLNVSAAIAVKQAVDVPTMVVGRIKDPLLAEYIIASGKADLVVMGRALVADPELPNKAAGGNFEDITPCISCGLGCIGVRAAGRAMTCLVNPSVGKEKEMVLSRIEKPKKVMIAGGGPAGLEVARVAAMRGHQVTLFEKTSELGGQFKLAAATPVTQENALLLRYLSTQVQKAGARIELGTEVTPGLVDEIKPDVIVIATGGAPLVPGDIPGTEKERVITAHDVLAGKAPVGIRDVVILGSGKVGCELADLLSEQGDNLLLGRTAVTIVGRRDNIAWDMLAEPRYLLLQSLRRKGVKWVTSAHVKEILDDGVVFVRHGREDSIRGMDCIILALGVKPVDELRENIKDKVSEVYVIGDAKEPRTALEAMAEAAEIARKI